MNNYNQKTEVAYSNHDPFFIQLVKFHADLINEIGSLKYYNISEFIDRLNAFVSGYPAYIRKSDLSKIKVKIKSSISLISVKDFVDIIFKSENIGHESLTKKEFSYAKLQLREIKKNLFEAFELINKNFADCKLFPQTTTQYTSKVNKNLTGESDE